MPAETILIVDDDPICLALAGIALRQAGFATCTAADGLEALEVLQNILPDLILSDIQMPNMDGFEFASRTRQIPRLCDIPMVALTAFTLPDTEQRAYAAGFNSYLAKPVTGDFLISHVRSYLDCANNSSTAA
jgi:CheY-like chemotaxis protein